MLEPPTPSGLTSNIDEPDPSLDYTLDSPKCFDDGYLSVNKLSIKTNTFVEDVYNVYKKNNRCLHMGVGSAFDKGSG